MQTGTAFLFFFIFMFLNFGCATSPTGRKQLIAMPSGQMTQLGDQSFAQVKKERPLSKDPKQNKLVKCVTERLLKAMGENPKEWEIAVFKDETANAFALPGNNMGVHTGMLELVKNQDQLAAVIGHEIGHVLAQHGNERMSQAVVTQLGLQVTEVALGNDSEQDKILMAALGLGAQVGVLLPFSRLQETEADRLGVKYMAEAGFDPREAAELWKLMAQNNKGAPPEFLSTHPSSESRIKDLSGLAPQYIKAYKEVSKKPKCG